MCLIVAIAGLVAACASEDQPAPSSQTYYGETLSPEARYAKHDVEQHLDEADSALKQADARLTTSEGSFQACEDDAHTEYAISAEWEVAPRTHQAAIRRALEPNGWEFEDDPSDDSPDSWFMGRGNDFAAILLEEDVLYIDFSNGRCVDGPI